MAELSLSLDDFASQNKSKGGKGRSGKRNARRSSRGGGGPIFERTARDLRQTGRRKTPYSKPSRADGRWTNDKFAEVQEEEESHSFIPQTVIPQRPVSHTPRTAAGDLRNTLKAQATKLYVSNVEKQITEEELLQLFAGIGTVKSIALHFDKEGNSRGTAEIEYASRASADEATDEFSGRTLDGQELLIEFITSGDATPAPAAHTSVTIDPMQNIQTKPVTFVNNFSYNDGQEEEDAGSFWGTAAGSNRQRSRRPVERRSRMDRRGNNRRGNNRRNDGGRRESKKDVSADDLDAQMEAYRAKAKKAAE